MEERKGIQSFPPINLSKTALSNLEAEESKYWGYQEMELCSFSPARTPKLQFSAEQPLAEECWIPPKKDTPHSKEKEKSQQDGRRGEIEFRIKPHTRQRCLESSNKSCVHQELETPQRLSQICV